VQLLIREFLSSLLGKKRKKERKSSAIGTNKEKGSKAISAVRFLNSVKDSVVHGSKDSRLKHMHLNLLL